jgi:hypothetical protein
LRPQPPATKNAPFRTTALAAVRGELEQEVRTKIQAAVHEMKMKCRQHWGQESLACLRGGLGVETKFAELIVSQEERIVKL